LPEKQGLDMSLKKIGGDAGRNLGLSLIQGVLITISHFGRHFKADVEKLAERGVKSRLG
jgi:hypothetical protein